MEHIPLSSIWALKLKKIKLSFRMGFCVYRLLDSLKFVLDKKNLNVSNDSRYSSINLVKMVNLDINYRKMEELIIEYIEVFITFIDEISVLNVACDSMEKKYNRLYHIKKMLEWVFYKDGNQNNPRSIILYKIFIQYYVSDFEMIKYLKKNLNRIRDQSKL